MGFYGNMTNSVKTNMTFDRKYSSRKNMDDMAVSDGVYAGRYILVEYGLDWTSSVVSDTYNNTDVNKIIKFYKFANNNNVIYKDSSCQTRYEGAEEGQVFYIGGKRSGSRTEACDELWIYKNNKYNLVTDKILDRTADANYVTNFNIDKEVYGAGRGYDSTVWTKTYGTDGIPRYVMIAELNAIIPTFTLSQHAPSANNDGRPFAPYFDELGTNVHYNMHVGTPWGMRIAKTDSANSDVGTQAIYYNKAGFEEFNRNVVNKADFISIADAKSGYNEYVEGQANDIKELSIYLPSIGNMVAKGWDVIHGPERDDSSSNSLQGRLDFFTNKKGEGIKENEIPVQSQNGYLVGATIGGDNWISCVIDSTKTKEDKIQVTHAISTQVPITVGNETLSLKFGDSFNIPRFTTDKAGHITAASDQIITLQAGSYTPANKVSESTEVITSIGFDAATGAITSTKADSSTLKLASYSVGTDATDVADGDTYNNAFAKLQNQINGLDYSNSSTTQVITGITQTDGLISITRGDAGTLALTGYELKEGEGSDADLLATDNLKTAFSKLQRQIHVEEAARAAAIDALDVSEITTELYEVISAVSETDGKISAKKKKAGTLTLSDYSKPSSGSAISPSDSLNDALGKLEYKLDTEINRVDNLDYTDPNTNTTQIITKVTQTDGKIEVVRSDAGTLLLTGYGIGTNGEKIASTDNINIAFAKLQTQINNIIGSEEIATNFDSIKKISDWLAANDTNADKVIDSIATLNSDETVTGSVQNQIKTAIENLDSEKTVTAGNYISGIHIVDGKITSVDETALPTYVSNVQSDWNATEGASTILNKPTNLVTSDQIVNMVKDTDIEGMVTESSPFIYPAITDSTGAEISPADTAMTIALLFEKVAALEARIYALEHPITETPDLTPEESGEETPTE